VNYRLELSRPSDMPSSMESSMWRLRIKLESVQWFDFVLNKEETNPEEFAVVARKFVDDVRNKLRDMPPVDPPTSQIIDPPDYCKFPATCGYGPTNCHKRHPKLMEPCEEKMIRADGVKRTCSFFFLDEFLVQPRGRFSDRLFAIAANKGFLLGNRREPTRDLMLAPLKHATNREVITYPGTWNMINDIYKTLQEIGRVPMLDGVGANFGKWETYNTNDDSQYALDCHGHIHLLLSRTATDSLSEEIGFNGLKGRVNHPTNYLEEDCRDLEFFRLISLEHSLLRHDMSSMKTDIIGIKTDIIGMKTDIIGIKTDMSKVCGTVDEILKTQSTILEMMQKSSPYTTNQA